MLKPMIFLIKNGKPDQVLKTLKVNRNKILNSIGSKSIDEVRQYFAIFLVSLSGTDDYSDQKFLFKLWARITESVPDLRKISCESIYQTEFDQPPWNAYRNKVLKRKSDTLFNKIWVFSKFRNLQDLNMWNALIEDVFKLNITNNIPWAICAMTNMFMSRTSKVTAHHVIEKWIAFYTNQLNGNKEYNKYLYLKGAMKFASGLTLLHNLKVIPQSSPIDYTTKMTLLPFSEVQNHFVDALQLWNRAYEEDEELTEYTARAVLGYALTISYYFKLNCADYQELSALRLVVSLSEKVGQDKYFILGVAELLDNCGSMVPSNIIERAQQLLDGNHYYCHLFKIALNKYMYHFEDDETGLIELNNETCEDILVDIRRIRACMDLPLASFEKNNKIILKGLANYLMHQTPGSLKLQWLASSIYLNGIGDSTCCITQDRRFYPLSLTNTFGIIGSAVAESAFWYLKLHMYCAKYFIQVVNISEAQIILEKIRQLLFFQAPNGDLCSIASKECNCQKCNDLQHIDFSLQLLCLHIYCSLLQKNVSPQLLTDAGRVMEKLKKLYKKEDAIVRSYSIPLYYLVCTEYLENINDFKSALKALKKASKYMRMACHTHEGTEMISKINHERLRIIQYQFSIESVVPLPMVIFEDSSINLIKSPDLTAETVNDEIASPAEINETSYYEEIYESANDLSNFEAHDNTKCDHTIPFDSFLEITALDNFYETTKVEDSCIDIFSRAAEHDESYVNEENNVLNMAFIGFADDEFNETHLS